MKANSMYIYLEGVRIFARHGVLPQETQVGSYFTIDLRLKTDFSQAARTDELEGTISYADVHTVLKEEMQIPSKLLEHVCERIAQRLFHDFASIEEIHIRLSKENPPMGADCKNVGVEVHYTR
ncbi:MAG: dihydroneopterin aldolase [Bacteroidales bacterium]|nr:dihydroneopterin aldolase [Bacteroidales bacterium]